MKQITSEKYKALEAKISRLESENEQLKLEVENNAALLNQHQLKETEIALKESELRYQTLFEKSKEPIAILHNGYHTDCNQAALDALKIKSKAEFQKFTPWDVSPKYQPDGRSSKEKAMTMMNIALEKGHKEFDWVHKDTLSKSILFNVLLTKVFISEKVLIYAIFRDITKQKEAEIALKKSEARFKELFINSPVAYQSLDQNGNFLYVNAEFTKLINYDTKEILGKKFGDYWIRKNRSQFQESFDNFCKKGEVSSELQLQTKAGKEITVLLNGRVQRDSQGNFVRTHCVLHNISKRKEQEEELKSLSNKLSKAQSIASVGHFEWYPDTGDVIGSDEYYRIFNSTSIDHNSFNDFIQTVEPDDREKVRSALEIAIKNKDYYDVEYRLISQGGVQKFVHAVGEFTFDNKGNPTYLLGIVHDITKQKEDERKIKENEQHLKTIFNVAQVGIVLTKNRKISFAIQFFLDLLKLKPEEVINKNALIIYPSIEDYEKLGKAKFPMLKKYGIASVETILKTKNDRILNVLMNSSFYNGKNEDEGIISVIADVTEQKHSEQKLLTANATKDKFFSIIAHDLKGPLNSVMGLTSLLTDNYENNNEEQKRTIISHISTSVKITHQLLDNLLTWSRSQSGKIKYTPERIWVKDYVLEAISMAQNIADSKDIEISCSINQDLYVIADKQTIDTVLRNLLSNAIKFTKRKGAISISAKMIKTDDQENKVEISVKDNGVGIPKVILDDLFNITSNVSIKGTENEAGTGLGLILCKEFTENNGGEIWAKSELGKGASFNFTLPEQITE